MWQGTGGVSAKIAVPGGPFMKPRVVIIDDHTLVADACRLLLGPACDVVGTFSEPRAFLEEAQTLGPTS